MSTLGVTQFLNLVGKWAAQRNFQFCFNWPVKGGWEGWIQVDLTAFVLAQDSTIDILREQSIFTSPAKRVDLLLNAASQHHERTPVELKAQSFENRERFVAGVCEDLDKLAHECKANYDGCTSILLALPFEQSSLDEVLAIHKHHKPIFTRLFVGEVAVAYAIHTKAGGWLATSDATNLA